MLAVAAIGIMDGVRLWPGALDAVAQAALIADVLERETRAPCYRHAMPKSGKLFSVEETNFGPLGWVSDVSGYLRNPQRTALARYAEGLRSAQNDLQLLHPLEPAWGIQPHLRRTGGEGR